MRFGIKGRDGTKIHFNKYVNQLINHPSREGVSGAQTGWLRERIWRERGVQVKEVLSGHQTQGVGHSWPWGPGLASHLPNSAHMDLQRVLPQKPQPREETESVRVQNQLQPSGGNSHHPRDLLHRCCFPEKSEIRKCLQGLCL